MSDTNHDILATVTDATNHARQAARWLREGKQDAAARDVEVAMMLLEGVKLRLEESRS